MIKYINSKKQRKLNYKNLTKYYRLLQHLQKPLTLELYRNMNLSNLKNTAWQVYSKAIQKIFNHVDAPSFKKFHTETLCDFDMRRLRRTLTYLLTAGLPYPTKTL